MDETAELTNLPIIVKNILELTEHKKITIAKLTESDISNLEKSIPPLLEDLEISEADYPQYLGRFSKNPSKFKFLPGQRSILLELVGFCNQSTFLNAGSNKSENKPSTALKRKANSDLISERGKFLLTC